MLGWSLGLLIGVLALSWAFGALSQPAKAGPDQATHVGIRILQHYDIIGFDPRGTGASSPVDCLGDDALTAYLAADPDPDDPSEESAFFASARAMGTGCAERSGEVAAHVSTGSACTSTVVPQLRHTR